ncbi:PE family protein [Mycobacterium asiaticum]|uniref:PE family protein n=1 Tax=Mycobacterium asiaticum TaxID=1790 RepID=UPI0005603DD5|nr:PE family protein [Mycobacterium asiaticum]ORA11700.1 PE family protein [Mycobacterium asiaticum DSM 44297]
MSFAIAAPELLQSAAQDLASINTSLAEATAVASAPTTGIAAAAQDEVSSAIASLFGNFGQEFQTLSAHSQIFHQEFAELMSAGARAYAVAEAANTQQTLLGALSATGQSSFANGLASGVTAAATSISGLASFADMVGAPYRALIANTISNTQTIGSTFSAYRFPFLQQFVSNQLGYGQMIAKSIAGGIANFPAELANLPAEIGTGVQQLLTINPGSVVQGFVDTQLNYAQTISGGVLGAARDLGTGLQSLPPGLTAAFQDLLSGNGAAAYADLNTALVNAFLPGFDATVTITGSTALVDIIPMGPLGELAPILAIPSQMAQNFTDLLPPGSVPAQISQNATNLVSALTNFGTTLSISDTAHLTFGLPLQLVLDSIGGPANALSAINASSVAFVSAIQAGNAPAAAAAILDAPAVIADAYLNGTTVISLPPALVDLLGTGTPLPSTTDIQLGGILAPLSLPQVFVNAGPGFEHLQLELSGDTEIGGLIPGVLTFGTQLAQAITPTS